MKHILFIAGMCCMAVSAMAQEDTSDVFSRHLHLKGVVVTGLTGDSRLNETPTAINVLDSRALRSEASTNIIDAIARQPGVSQISTGNGISKPVIRGLGYNRVVVIADGIRQEGQQWGDEHGIELDGNAVNSAEIIKGPASLMYGSDALAGVIIFHPYPNPAPGYLTGGFSSEYQSNNGLAAYSIYQGGNIDGNIWNLRYSDKYAHSYRNAADGLVPGTQFRERAIGGKAGINRKWGYSNLTLGYYHLTPGMAEGYEEGPLEGPTGYRIELPFQQVRHYKAVLDNTIMLGEGRIKALAGLQQNRRQEFEEETDEAELDFRLGTLNYDIRYISGNIDGWKVSTGTGGMYQESENLGEEVLIPAYRLFDIGQFLTASKAMEKVHLSGGIRADMRNLHSFSLDERFNEFTRRYWGITASAGAVYSPIPNLNIRANLSRGFRAPNLSELGSNGVHEGTVRHETGNQDLKPEFSLQGDLGADFSTEHMTLSAALFRNSITNYIFASRSGAVIDGYQDYRYTSSDALLFGGEASVDIHPIHRLHLGSRFSYVRGTFEEGNLPLMPAPRLDSEIKWELTHNGRIFNDGYLSFQVSHSFAQYHFLEGTETATPAYILLGVSAATDILMKGRRLATLILMADNLLDTVYVDHLNRLKYVGLRNQGRNITIRLEVPLLN